MMNPEYVWSVISPHTHASVSAPPSVYTLSSFTQRIDFSSTFITDDEGQALAPPIPSQSKKIPTSSGAYLWFVNSGVHNMIRVGFVSTGTVTVGIGTPALGIGLRLPLWNYSLVTPLSMLWTSTALPYSNRYASTDQVSFSPDVSKVFSKARTIAGSMLVSCDSAVVGNIPLVGILSAGTYTDIRTIQQVWDSQSEEYVAYDNDTMMQMAATPKDNIDEIRASNGVVTICGPDISPFLTIPNTSIQNIVNGSIHTYVGTGFLNRGPGVTVDKEFGKVYFPGFAEKVVISAAWITPWNTSLQQFSPSVPDVKSGVVGQNINFEEHIGINGVLDIEVAAFINPWNTDPIPPSPIPSPPPPIVSYEIQFVHVFASCDSTGAIEFSTYEEQSMFGVLGETTNGQTAAARTTARTYHYGYNPHRGMYIGTTVFIYSFVVSPAPLSLGNGGGIGGLSYVTYRVTGRDNYVMGELGPVRVIKYANLSQGTAMSLRGMVHVQGTPFGSVAPFVNSDPTGSASDLDISLVPRLSRMFDGINTPLRRVWDNKEFLRFIAKGKPSQSMVDRWLSNSEDTDEGNRKRSAPINSFLTAQTPQVLNVRTYVSMSDRLKNMDTNLTFTNLQTGDDLMRKIARAGN